LQNLTKLRTLYIPGTDIDSGLEYLPDSVRTFDCELYYRKDAKIKAIRDLFANERGIVEESGGNIKNFPQKLQAYKQKLQAQSQQTAQILQPAYGTPGSSNSNK